MVADLWTQCFTQMNFKQKYEVLEGIVAMGTSSSDGNNGHFVVFLDVSLLEV